ncbi:hypothetical protein BH11BAC4_BH11BAC4_08210 [soil metagenome]
MKRITLSFLFTLVLCKFHADAQTSDGYILNENFDRNRLGWVEEFTEYHYTGIKEGFLYILSKDTSRVQTSNGPQNNSALWDLPEEYEITTSISKLPGKTGAAYGVILNSATLGYKFSFSDEGLAELIETDYNNDSREIYIFSRKAKFPVIKKPDSIQIKIIIAQRKFSYYVNDELINTGEFNCRSWEGIRLFVTSGFGIKADYLRIRKIK